MEWLIAIIALIVGLIIGWWLANRACQQQHGIAASVVTPEPEPAVPAQAPQRFAEAAPVAAPEKDPDDLTKIEGVGPKIAELLNMGGIYTYPELAETQADRIKELLMAGGERFRVHDPGTWPQQARLAADEKWDELQVLQDELDGGRPA